MSPRIEKRLATLFTPSPSRVGHPGDPYNRLNGWLGFSSSSSRLVADAYMAIVADVAAAPAAVAATVGPVSYVVWFFFTPLV